jgi:hypothetical protein
VTPINATLLVRTSADSVWALITHFAKYAEWNHLTPTIKGDARLNERLVVTLAPMGLRPSTLRARVLVAARNRELRWCGTGRLPGGLKLEHGFRIEQRADGCRLFHSLTYAGWRANDRLIAALGRSFDATNAALLARINGVPAAPLATATPQAVEAAQPLMVTTA